ncbi:LAMI_0E05006g1_1 [Lachancea mirantina]|uniref:LAMI_0E05006g1_1 n=1 Tax=Lachancea mirantina TaxID=1230905 RepID=A0A1G4JL15_9SACH|nr:LAMI_0E05006g1_1 [Lachancea mirantina]
MDLLKILDTVPEPAIVDAKTMGVSGNISGDYWLPTPMCLYQKQLSDQIVSLHYSDILKYFETHDYNQDVVVASMKTMCLNSEYVATHPYLLIDHLLPKSLITKDIPNNIAETSGKFSVLRDLINLIQDYRTETVIVCRPGRTSDLLEALLLGNRVNIKRYDGQSVKVKQKSKKFPCTCHIFASDPSDFDENSVDGNIHFDLVLCLDPSVNTREPHIQKALRQQRPSNGPGNKAPIVRLVTINSIDHCELFFEKQIGKDSKDFIARVSAAVVVMRDSVGTLPPDLRPIYSQNLKYLVAWLEDPSLPWPLPDIYPLKTYTPMDVERSLLTEVKYNQNSDILEEAFQSGRKRGRKPNSSLEQGQTPVSFYKMKRLQNDYSSNPLKQDMAQLTGINAIQHSDATQYHLAGGLLTHKLIQSIGMVYTNLDIQSTEIRHFEDIEASQLQRSQVLQNDLISITRQFQEAQRLEITNEEEAVKYHRLTDQKLIQIAEVQKTVDELIDSLASKGPDFKELSRIYRESLQVQEDIEREQRISESRISESSYMGKEITRAEEVIKEKTDEKALLLQQIEDLNAAIDQQSKEDHTEEDRIKERVEKLKSQISSEWATITAQEEQTSELCKDLKKIQFPKIRASQASGRKKQRQVNYT